MLNPLLGSDMAATLFGIALLCCGINSTVTATLAGQVVMEGFINIRLKPALRRLVTRGIAIVPAMFAVMYYGQSGTTKLLVMSQVVLSLQLPFAVIPLVWITARRKMMGNFTAPRWQTVLAATASAVIVGLNVKLLIDVWTG
jgi:manganese transport protein